MIILFFKVASIFFFHFGGRVQQEIMQKTYYFTYENETKQKLLQVIITMIEHPASDEGHNHACICALTSQTSQARSRGG